MKQITPEIKAKIFALYWGQDICYWPTSFESPFQKVIITDYTMRNAWLEVKPLSSITDEDAIEVANIRGDWTGDFGKEKQFWGKATINLLENSNFSTQSNIPNLISIVDYLRSKGYALPAYGFSVDELVEAGVFKLKEVNND